MSNEIADMKALVPGGLDLSLIRMRGREGLSELFEYEVDLFSTEGWVDHEQVLGKPMAVEMPVRDGAKRYFHGYVARFARAGRIAEYYVHRATLRPWLWMLTRTSNSRIFQQKSVPDILSEVFDLHGMANFRKSLSVTYPKREYCVQYQETDFAFVSRLMEEEGIYYFFKHEAQRHQMVLVDSVAGHDPFPGYSEVPFLVSAHGGRVADEFVDALSATASVQPGSVALGSYDYLKPTADLGVLKSDPAAHDLATYEVYEFSGRHLTTGDGERHARVRLEAATAQYERFSGSATARGVAAGTLLKIDKAPVFAGGKPELLVLDTEIRLERGGLDVLQSRVAGFECRFSAIWSRQPFRAPLATPRPVMRGPQTAIVTGKDGEEIWTDAHGRVKVLFHWDRFGKQDESSSCWVRVSQPLAGQGWGFVALPRIGQEVIVEFLDGDPDRPIVTGRVYNENNRAPWELPGQALVSGIKTYTSKGGSGFNEIALDDTAGEELMRIHAQKDQTLLVEHDRVVQVKNESHLSVGADHFVNIDKGSNLTVGQDRKASVGGEDHLDVTGDQNVKVGGGHSLQSTQDWQVKAGKNLAAEAGMNVHIKAGMNVVLEAGFQLTIKAGSNFISLSPAGISIVGSPMVLINSGGAAGAGAGARPNPPAKPAEARKLDDVKENKEKSAKKRKPKKPQKMSASATSLKAASNSGSSHVPMD